MHEPRAVLVTGASSGIGAACVGTLDRLGFRVFVGVRRNEDGERLRQSVSSRVTPLMLDVTDQESIHIARDAIAASVGDRGLIGLVNNAGIAVWGPLEAMPVETLRRQLEVNVIGLVAVTQAMLPLLRTARGRIVNISSVSGRLAVPFLGQYAASKFAVRALSDALRGELRQWGIDVSMIEPGQIATAIWGKAAADGEAMLADCSDESRALYGETIKGICEQIKKIGGLPPDRVARAVVHALTARRPRTCYVVGVDARLGRLFARLPDRWRDWLIMRRMPGHGAG